MSVASEAITIAERYAETHKPLAALASRLRAVFFRFLEKLPEANDDVDPEVLKRVRVPI